MRPFEFRQVSSVPDAVQSAEGVRGAFLAGGTTLLDLMKLDVMRPERVTAIGRLPLSEVREQEDGGLRIGALVTMTHAAEHDLVAKRYPVLRDALLAGASQQIRNMASMGGNVMQRTRCGYFRDPQFRACNKRDPGSGCAALEGLNRKHAVLGGETTPGPGACVAVHASDAAVALVALDARLTLQGPDGERQVALEDFLLTPGGHPDREHDLRGGELITAIVLPAPLPGARSTYLKVRDRESYEFALASAAVVLKVDGGVVREVRVALGGVATVPWRAHAAERELSGQPATPEIFERAARAELAAAHPLRENGFKVPLATRVIVRALGEVSGGESR